MSRSCNVARCKQRVNSNKGDNGEYVSFHPFPKETETVLRKEWMKSIHRNPNTFKITNYSRVCSRHFLDSDFVGNKTTKNRQLKKEAIPSIFDWDSSYDWYRENRSEEELTSESIASEVSVKPEVSNELLGEETKIKEENVKETTSESLDGEVPKNPEVGVSKEILDEEITIKEENDEDTTLELVNSIHELTLETLRFKKLLEEKEVAIKNVEKLLELERQKKSLLVKRLAGLTISINSMKHNNEDVQFYTGLPNYRVFVALLEYLDPGENGENIAIHYSNYSKASKPGESDAETLKPADQLFLVLMRLRLGLFGHDLAKRFGVSQSGVSKITTSWINFMYMRLGQLRIWAPREVVDETMPLEFKRRYPSTRVILCATEIICEKTSSLKTETYPNYKSTKTLKGLLGIMPCGLVSFISALYPASISDAELTRQSGFLDKPFAQWDSVMASEGFMIENMLKEKGLNLNIPPFLRSSYQFPKEDLEESKKQASLKIHVERTFQRVHGFHIFDRPIPISLAPITNELWTVCAVLTNFQSAIISNPGSSSNEKIEEMEELECPINFS